MTFSQAYWADLVPIKKTSAGSLSASGERPVVSYGEHRFPMSFKRSRQAKNDTEEIDGLFWLAVIEQAVPREAVNLLDRRALGGRRLMLFLDCCRWRDPKTKEIRK